MALSREADLVIAECAYQSGQGSDDWPHLNPETAARIAKEARAKRLAIVHFDARTIFPHTFATIDDMELDL